MSEVQGAWNPQKVEAFKQAFFDFIQHVKINSKETGGGTILGEKIYTAQKIFLDSIFDGLSQNIHSFYVLKSRQLGISTMSRALSIFWLGMHPGLQGAMVFDTIGHRDEARNEIISMIDDLPPKLKFPKKTKDGRDLLTLSNGSTLRFLNAGVSKRKSGGTLGRSSGLNFAHLSELCSFDNDEGMVSFENALSETYPDRLYIYESTARGFNRWYKMWQEALADKMNRKTCFIGWWAKETQRIAKGTPAFEKYGTAPPTPDETEKVQRVKDLYGFEITQEQLAWYRRKSNPIMENVEGADREDGIGVVDELTQQEQPWCVTRETRVGTNKGVLRIEDALVGMQATLGEIKHAGRTGKAIIWRATTKLGYQIRGTANHPLIDIEGQEIRLDKSLGKIIKLQPPRFSDDLQVVRWKDSCVDCSVSITPDFARFVGLFMGDGCAWDGGNGTCKNNFVVQITCDSKDMDVVDECCRLFRTCFGQEPVVRKGKGNWIDVRLNSRKAVESLRSLGLLREGLDYTARKVCVPEFIWRSPKHIVKEFLSGIFEADGFNAYQQHRVAIFSKYTDFMHDIQLLLLGFGITARGVYGVKKRAGDGHFYTGNQLELRAEEARAFNTCIGFISSRKTSNFIKVSSRPKKRKGNYEKNKIPMFLEDEIVSVINEGVIEEVFNLTVEGEHLFDANGILTHNTAEEAFLQSGSTFIAGDRLTEISKEDVSDKYDSYYFTRGQSFLDCDFFPLKTRVKNPELRVWEEPDEHGVYIVAGDPAFGHSEESDNSCCQVLRAYADCCEQVAEYAHNNIQPEHFAWVIAALAGWYKNAYIILELNGPGEAVWIAMKDLKQTITTGHLAHEAKEKGLRDIFMNVHNYMYARADSMSAPSVYHFKTTGSTKVGLMERARDFITSKSVVVRSEGLVQEMRTITRKGDQIQAEGTNRDDRFFALALGLKQWQDVVKRVMSTGGRTRAYEMAARRMTLKDQIGLFNKHKLDTFFKQNQHKRAMEQSIIRRQAWRNR